MNIEYVYLILFGVNLHLQSERVDDSEISINLTDLSFQNLDQWNVSRNNSMIAPLNNSFGTSMVEVSLPGPEQTIKMNAEIISVSSAMFQRIQKLDGLDSNMLKKSLALELNRNQVFKSG